MVTGVFLDRAASLPDAAKIGRGERIRTSGPCLPKTVLYQAELLPDRNPLRYDGQVAAGAKAAPR
jgi:hypothetical protein